MSGLIGNVRSSVGSTQLWISDQWTQRVVQVSVYTAVIFFILSSYPLINTVEKSVKSVSSIKLGKDGTLALHSVIFGLFMYVGTRFILDPLLIKAVNGRVEGMKGMKEMKGQTNYPQVWDPSIKKDVDVQQQYDIEMQGCHSGCIHFNTLIAHAGVAIADVSPQYDECWKSCQVTANAARDHPDDNIGNNYVCLPPAAAFKGTMEKEPM